MTFAQGWQDWYLWHNIFKRSPAHLEWGGGFYVDLGTNSPTIVSNTLFFE